MVGHKDKQQCDIIQGPFRCARCSDAFSTKPEYEKHYYQAHFQHLLAKEVTKTCNDSSELDKHKAVKEVVKTNGEVYDCKLCSAKLKYKSSLNIHMSTCHVKGGLYKCDRCCCCYNTRLSFQKHYKGRHGIKFVETASRIGNKDQSNRKVANGLDTSKIHSLRSKSGASRTVTVFNHKTNQTMMKTEKAFPFRCDLCEMVFSSSSNRKVHVKSSHVPGGKFKCSFCPCIFLSEMSRKTHHNFRHVGDAKNKLVASRIFKNVARRKLSSLKSCKALNSKSRRNRAKPEPREEESEANPPPDITRRLPKTKDGFHCDHCSAEFSDQSSMFSHIVHEHKSKLERINLQDMDIKTLISIPFHVVRPAFYRKENHSGTTLSTLA